MSRSKPGCRLAMHSLGNRGVGQSVSQCESAELRGRGLALRRARCGSATRRWLCVPGACGLARADHAPRRTQGHGASERRCAHVLGHASSAGFAAPGDRVVGWAGRDCGKNWRFTLDRDWPTETELGIARPGTESVFPSRLADLQCLSHWSLADSAAILAAIETESTLHVGPEELQAVHAF